MSAAIGIGEQWCISRHLSKHKEFSTINVKSYEETDIQKFKLRVKTEMAQTTLMMNDIII